MKDISVEWLNTVVDENGVTQFESSVLALYGKSKDGWLDSEHVSLIRIAEHESSDRDVYKLELVIKNPSDWELQEILVNGVAFGRASRIEYIKTSENSIYGKDFSSILAIEAPDGWVAERLSELGISSSPETPSTETEPEPETEVYIDRIEQVAKSLETYDGRFRKDGSPYLKDIREHSGLDDLTNDELAEAVIEWGG